MIAVLMVTVGGSLDALARRQGPAQQSSERQVATRLGAAQQVGEVGPISRFTGAVPSDAQADTQVEPDVALDPNDPDRLVAVFQQGRFDDGGSVAPGYATSHDGGATWTTGALPSLTTATGGAYPRASDPVVAFGPDGTVYAQTLVVDLERYKSGLVVQRSDDGGLTFSGPYVIQEEQNPSLFNDKNWLVVDQTTGPFAGRLYSAWSRTSSSGTRIVLRYSDDRGETWSQLVPVSETGRFAIGVIPLIQPSGQLTLVYLEYSSSGGGTPHLMAQSSIDGGGSFSPAVEIAAVQEIALPDQRAPALPSAAVDPVGGRMYAVWHDGSTRSDGSTDVVLSSSLDGLTWSDPVRVVPGDGRRGRTHFTPDVGVYGGRVHITYTTRAETDRGFSRFARQRYVWSEDAGLSFGDDLLLGPRIDLRYSARAAGLKFLGDYVGIAVAEGVAHPVWARSSRDSDDAGNREQRIWSATVAN